MKYNHAKIIYILTFLLLIAANACLADTTIYNEQTGKIFTVDGNGAHPSNYPAGDQAVLAQVIKASDKVWFQNSVYGVPFGNNCGDASDAARKEIAKVLPEGWSITKIGSVDVSNNWSTNSMTNHPSGHVCNVIRAPDGTMYMADNYLVGTEFHKMKIEKDIYGEYLVPDSGQNDIMSSQGALIVAGNIKFKWRKHPEALTQDERAYLDPMTNLSPQAYLLAKKNSKPVSFNPIQDIVLPDELAPIDPTEPFPQFGTYHNIQFGASCDPNEISGPDGYGDKHYIDGKMPIIYLIDFENLPAAVFPAVDVVVTDKIDLSLLDSSTFSFGDISFGDSLVTPEPSLNDYTTQVDLRPAKNLIVKINAKLNTSTGVITWTFNSIDPVTGNPPEDPTVGFLPPDKNVPEGQGRVIFEISPKSNIAADSVITNQADIVFDTNPVIKTAVWTNTIDNVSPTSKVEPLKPMQVLTTFPITWSGLDGSGSGIKSYKVYMSVDGGNYTILLNNTQLTSTMFKGEKGKTYSFYTVAEDNAGNIESVPSTPDTQTKVSDNADSVEIRMDSLPLISYTSISDNKLQYTYRPTIKNAGNVDASSVVVTLLSVPNGCEIVDGQVSCGAMKTSDVSSGTDTFSIRADYSDPIASKTAVFKIDTITALGVSTQNIACALNIPSTLDEQKPVLDISVPSLSITQNGPVTYSISYSGANTISLKSSDIKLNKTGTASADISVTGDGTDSRTISLSNITGYGSLGISVLAGSAVNVAGLPALPAGPSKKFVVDSLGSAVKITVPTENPEYLTGAALLNISGTADAKAKKVSWLNSSTKKKGTCKGKAAWSAAKIALKPGDNIITVSADKLGSDTIIVTYVDIIAPVVKIKSPTSKPNYISTKSKVAISGTAADNTATTMVSWVNETTGDSGNCTGTKSWKTSLIPLKLDENLIKISAVDSVGNLTTAVIIVTYVDKVKPKVSITSPTTASAYKTNQSSINITGSASDDNVLTSVSWTNSAGGSGTCTGTSNWTASSIALQPGKNKITVTATDSKNNKTTDTLTVTYSVK